MSSPVDSVSTCVQRGGEVTIEWTGIDDDSIKNPRAIETFFKETIKSSQVTLLGEIDLNTPVNYGGTNWSLAELSEYLIEKPVIVSNLSKNSLDVIDYAATIAIWAVSRAQNLETGTELWTNSGFGGGQLTKLPEKFSRSIEALGLETFAGQLEGRQKHIALARLHAMIPVYATHRFVEVVRNSFRYLRSKESLHYRILQDDSVSEAVRMLCELEPEISLDLLDRCLQVLSTGKNAGLPQRLTNALLENYKVNFQSRNKQINFPVIRFSETESEVYVQFANGWTISSNGKKLAENDKIELGIVRVHDSNGFESKILDTGNGFLAFDLDQNLINSVNIPSTGIFLLWSNEFNINQDCLGSEIFPIYDWPNWNWAYIKPNIDIKLSSQNGKTFNLKPRKVLEISENRIRGLKTLFDEDIFSSWPIIGANQVVRIINNLDGATLNVGIEGGPITGNESGQLDVSIFGGLGKSRNLSGLVIPGLKVVGLERPLVHGESRIVDFTFPIGWKAPKQLQVKAENVEKLPHVVVEAPSGDVHHICVDIPVLNWTLEMRDGSTVRMQKLQRFKLNDVKEVRSLVLHEIPEGYTPNIYVHEKNKKSIASKKASIHDHDARIDLRSLKDSNETSEFKIVLNWQGEQLELVSFGVPERFAPKMRSVSQEELLNYVKQSNWFSEEEWASYEAEKAKDNFYLKARARNQRSFRR